MLGPTLDITIQFLRVCIPATLSHVTPKRREEISLDIFARLLWFSACLERI